MNPPQASQIHAALSTAYEHEFGNNRLQDEVWVNVHRISLHCLTTGILILEGAGDAKYSRIPPEALERLKRLAHDNPDELPAYAAAIMRRLREDLAAFRPQFKVVVLNGPLDKHRFIWKKALYSYSLSDDGFPVNPRDIYDVVFREFQQYGVVTQVLVKDENDDEAQAKALTFLEDGMEKLSAYDEQIREVLKQCKLVPAGEKGKQVAIDASKVWNFKIAIIEDPVFKEYIQDVYINRPNTDKFLAQVLSELKQIV